MRYCKQTFERLLGFTDHKILKPKALDIYDEVPYFLNQHQLANNVFQPQRLIKNERKMDIKLVNK